MENVKSLFSKEIWAKLETNKKLVSKGKEARYSIFVPGFDFAPNGEVVDLSRNLRITTIEQAEEYDKKYAKVLEILKEKYPNLSRVRRIFTASLKDAVRELSCGERANGQLNTCKILSGKNLSNAVVISNLNNAGRKDSILTVKGFLNTLKDYEGKEVLLPKAERPSKAIMREFRKNREGYYVPQITAKGLVVVPLEGSNNKAFDSWCSAFSSSDVTREMVIEYLKAPFGDKKVNVDFEKLADLSKATYRSIGQDNFVANLETMMDYVAKYYPLDFSQMKEDKVENAQLKKKMEEMYAVPAMLPEATAQTLVDEQRTRMTQDDALNVSEERAALVALIHQKIKKEKLLQGASKQTKESEKTQGATNMPELDMDELFGMLGVDAKNESEQKSEVQKEQTQVQAELQQPQVQNDAEQPIAVNIENGNVNFTLIINNYNEQSEKAEETIEQNPVQEVMPVEKPKKTREVWVEEWVPIASQTKDVYTGKPRQSLFKKLIRHKKTVEIEESEEVSMQNE